MVNNCYKVTPLIGDSDFIQNLKGLVSSVGANTASVLISGERGTGKKLLAQRIHYATGTNQTKRDFYEINCKVCDVSDAKMTLNGITRFIPVEKKISLFINHIDELNEELQLYFLKCIEEIRKLGLQVKIISSAESNLEEKVESKKFLKDLFFQISTVVINTVPLRQRKEDIMPIAEFYRQTFAKQSGINLQNFSDKAKDALENQFWKGNVDELINSIQKAFMVSDNQIITVNALGINAKATEVPVDVSDMKDNENGNFMTLKDAVDEFKKAYLIKVLEANGWNQTKTARILGIQRTYVIKLINELEIKR